MWHAEDVLEIHPHDAEQRGVRDGALHAVSGVLSKMAVDAFREFVPLHRKPAPPGGRD